MKADVFNQYGELPIVAMLNKSDLSELWEINDDILATSKAGGLNWIRSSAKTGDNVAEAVEALAEKIMSLPADPT